MSEDILYYNLEIGVSNYTAQQANYTGYDNINNAQITAQNQIPIVTNPNDYYCSIVRMVVPQFNIPISYFDVFVDASGNVTDPNKGIYSFTLKYGTNQIHQHIYWVQQDQDYQVPTGTKPVASEYYFIWDYQYFIDRWNEALKTAYDQLYTLVGAPLTANTPPFFMYNDATQEIELYTVKAFSDLNASGTVLEIYCNEAMEKYVFGLSAKYYRSLEGLNMQFLVKTLPNATTPLNVQQINSVDYIVIKSQSANLSYWNMLKNIIVTTNMPVVQESFFQGYNPNSNAGMFNGSQNVLLNSILTDYIPDLTNGNGAFVASSTFIYNASSLWRLFQFSSKLPLYNINVTVYFTDYNNNSWLLRLYNKNVMSLKFMFIKKSLISQYMLKSLKI